LLLVVAVWLLAACSPGRDSNDRQRRLPAVEAMPVHWGTLPINDTLTAAVRAKNQTLIHAELAGPVVAIYVDEGDAVVEGDILLSLRKTEFNEKFREAKARSDVMDARLKQANAQLERVSRQMQRMRELWQQRLISEYDFDFAKLELQNAEAERETALAELRQAQALLAVARDALRDTDIRAPTAGVIGTRNVEVGMRVDTDDALFQIGDLSQVKVRVALTKSMRNQLNENSRIIVNRGDGMQAFVAPITRVEPFFNPATQTTEAEIDVPNNEGYLRPGLFVTVTLHYTDSEPAVLVPNSAIYRNTQNGALGVFRINNLAEKSAENKNAETAQRQVSAQFVAATIIAQTRTQTAIRGITRDSWVVTQGQHLLSANKDNEVMMHPASWEQTLALQALNNRDLLLRVFEKHRRENAVAPSNRGG